MSSILLVDDLRNFKREVLTQNGIIVGDDGSRDHLLRICRTSQSAVEVLGTDDRHWDQIWLDHDLGMNANGEDDTTMAVVDYILFRHNEGNPVKARDYIIHSSNPVGVRRIAAALQSIGRNSVIVDPRDFFTV